MPVRHRSASARALTAAALLPLVLAAAPAHAAWPVRDVPTDHRTAPEALVPLPDGRVATLLLGWTRGHNRLTLAVGDARAPIGERRTTIVDAGFVTAPRADADGRGRVTVAYVASDGPSPLAPDRLTVWTDGRAQTIAEDAPVDDVDLDVAADGTAVVAWSGPRGVRVARRAPEATAFSAPVVASTGVPGVGGHHHPQVAALADGGAAVAAIGQRAGGVLRRALGDAPLGPPQTFVVPERTRRVIDAELVATTDVLTFVFVAETRPRGPRPRGARARLPVPQTVRWALDADAPAGPVTIRSGPRAASLRTTVAGGRTFVAFRDIRDADGRTTGDIRVGTVEADGSVRRTGSWRGAGYVEALVPDGAGTRVFTRVDGTVLTRRFDAAGRPGRADGVARVPRWQRGLLAAEVDGRPLALWSEPAPGGPIVHRAQPEP